MTDSIIQPLVHAAGVDPRTRRNFSRPAQPPDLTFYREHNLFVLSGATFTLLSTATGLIAPSTYLRDDTWLEGAQEIRGCRYLEGSHLVIGNADRTSYYHWVYQAYASLLVALASGVELGTHKVLGPRLTPWRRQYLELVPGVEYVEADEDKSLIVEHAVFSNVLWQDFSFNPRAEILQAFERLEPGQSSSVRKIYVSRADTRRRPVVNEQAVIERLASAGFVEVRLAELSVREQIALFRGVDEVVAPHGAGLVNLLFAKPTTKVVELLPSNYLNRCFWAIASAKGMTYRGLVNPVRDSGKGHRHDGLVVDLAALEALIA